jgi:hypothetical protein
MDHQNNETFTNQMRNLLIEIRCVDEYHTLNADENLKKCRFRRPLFLWPAKISSGAVTIGEEEILTSLAMYRGEKDRPFHSYTSLD